MDQVGPACELHEEQVRSGGERDRHDVHQLVEPLAVYDLSRRKPRHAHQLDGIAADLVGQRVHAGDRGHHEQEGGQDEPEDALALEW